MLRVARWLIFSAVVSLAPLVYVYVDLLIHKQPATLE
jgi:hypothetical protein